MNFKRIICYLLLLSNKLLTNGDRWRLIEDDDIDFCTNSFCGTTTTKPHTMCNKIDNPGKKCEANFKFLPIDINKKEAILNGHNGIRYKMANKWKISNMLLLHWDPQLHEMSCKWVNECINQKDSCNYIFNQTVTVGQNIEWYSWPPDNNWESNVIREWYAESKDVHSFRSLLRKNSPNFLQMIWPKTEFVSCCAARNAYGYIMACNYSPAVDLSDSEIYLKGESCTTCPNSRPTCSRIFAGLCGIDQTFKGASSMSNIKGILILFCLIINFI